MLFEAGCCLSVQGDRLWVFMANRKINNLSVLRCHSSSRRRCRRIPNKSARNLLQKMGAMKSLDRMGEGWITLSSAIRLSDVSDP